MELLVKRTTHHGDKTATAEGWALQGLYLSRTVSDRGPGGGMRDEGGGGEPGRKMLTQLRFLQRKTESEGLQSFFSNNALSTSPLRLP